MFLFICIAQRGPLPFFEGLDIASPFINAWLDLFLDSFLDHPNDTIGLDLCTPPQRQMVLLLFTSHPLRFVGHTFFEQRFTVSHSYEISRGLVDWPD